MDNNELDKIIKEKLNNKIKPSAEFEGKIQNVIRQKQNEHIPQKKKVINFNGMTKIISVAAIFVVVFTVGILINKRDGENETTIDVTSSIKAIEPTKLNSGVLANDSEFLIYTEEDNANVESVQKSVFVEPALDYTIEKTGNGNEYKLKFKQNIPDNTIVKLQYVKNKITENSWAYQTSNKLSVTSAFPSDEETASTKTAIEVDFSYANVENVENNVEITPSVEGSWTHLGKKWRFIPNSPLKKNTQYTVRVKKGISVKDQTLEQDYVFKFETYKQGDYEYCEYAPISLDGINNYKNDEAVRMYYVGEATPKKVSISRFNTEDDFIEYLTDKTMQKAVDKKEVKFDVEKREYNNYIQLKDTLQNGYYVATVEGSKNRELFNCPIQINDLSAYVMESERDVISWVASENNLAGNINVEFKNKTIQTNNEGIATFEDINEGSEKTQYMKIGNQGSRLIVGVYEYNTNEYPSAYIYTDRPLYKNTDTVNIWGVVPVKQFYDGVENQFYIKLNDEEKQKVEVGEDGNLNYKLQLNNHTDDGDYSVIRLYYKEQEIASRDISISNYELQNYNYEMIMNKNYAYEGDKFEFDVKATHITGLAVANKEVIIKYGEETQYRETTNEDGIAHFSIDIPESEDVTTELTCLDISIYNGEAEEYTDSEDTGTVYILNRTTYTEQKEKNGGCDVTLYKLVKDKDVKTSFEEVSKLYDGVYNTSVKISLSEQVWRRTLKGYVYNEYTKENEPQYSFEQAEENHIDVTTVNTQNGKFSINYDDFKDKIKPNTDEENYTYNIEISYKDTEGREIVDIENYYISDGGDIYNSGIGYYYAQGFEEFNNADGTENMNINSGLYYTYRYLLKNDNQKCSIGDNIKFTLAESTSSGVKDIQNQGRILRIVFQEDFNKVDIISDNNLDYTFSEEEFPGCKITTAYFVNGKFYRMPVYCFDFDEEDRKTDVEIVADKEEYKPGDEVNLKVKTTCGGKKISSFVNISVVNEGVFKASEYGDDTSILSTIYRNKTYPVYTYSNYTDNLSDSLEGGGGGGMNGVRADFGDTAYFETVYTNQNGEAEVSFKLPDNVTTYRVTAHSANEDLYVGVDKIDITSKLDFFIQSTEPRKVKASDDLVLTATSVASENYEVEFNFTIEELNKSLTAKANTNKFATANFGKLKSGKYTAIITGKYGDKTDTIKYEFEVVETAQEVKNKQTVSINGSTEIKPTKNPIMLEIYNKDMEQNLKYIDFVESTVTSRLDTMVAYNKIQTLKNEWYGEENSGISIDIGNYSEGIFKNLNNSKEDMLLTALMEYYAKDYCFNMSDISLTEDRNLFEYYLYSAAKGEPVLLDLLYLKDEPNIDNYGKLLVTLSLQFLGDYQNAQDLYKTINLTGEEKQEYASIVAMIDTFIDDDKAAAEINNLMQTNPSDEYLRFAIISALQNASKDIEKQETVIITSKNVNETITLNGMQVKTLTLYDEDLDTIKFETSSDDLLASYYYQTSLSEIQSDNIKQDVNINLSGELEKNSNVTLSINFEDSGEGEVRVALPNSLRLVQNYSNYLGDRKFYIEKNNIDYITIYKLEGCDKIELPLLVTLDGNYNFENVVFVKDGVYHISNSGELTINK